MANDVAWAPILTEDGTIPVGETVTRAKLGVDQEEYDLIKASGAIREKPYPKGIGAFESPRELVLRKIRELVEDAHENALTDLPDYMSESDVAAANEAVTPTAREGVEVKKGS